MWILKVKSLLAIAAITLSVCTHVIRAGICRHRSRPIWRPEVAHAWRNRSRWPSCLERGTRIACSLTKPPPPELGDGGDGQRGWRHWSSGWPPSSPVLSHQRPLVIRVINKGDQSLREFSLWRLKATDAHTNHALTENTSLHTYATQTAADPRTPPHWRARLGNCAKIPWIYLTACADEAGE